MEGRGRGEDGGEGITSLILGGYAPFEAFLKDVWMAIKDVGG